MPVEFFSANCPACGHHIAVPFFDGGQHPLATLAWPTSAEAARSLPRLPLDFVMCVDCGHVFNRSFDYTVVPYSEKPNLMFNRGFAWSGFLQGVRDSILSGLSASPVVVEIGYGDGSFLAALAAERPAGRYVGFDPNGAASGQGNIDYRSELFDPARHLAELRPELIISRHVLEHLVNPVGFIQGISFAASMQGLAPQMYMEVPCIDAAIAGGRSVDFYYEHGSQFTSTSFQRMLGRATAKILEIGHGYGGEVVFGLVELGAPAPMVAQARRAVSFRDGATAAVATIADQLASLHAAGNRVAIWGGTGKSAAFMCRFCVDAERFPLVVDSDPTKVGTFVPGTGQEIRFRDWLRDHPVDVVIIPPQWRAADIVAEMATVGIAPAQILIEHSGRLIDFWKDDHPYRRP
jgi:hypothetical protein